MGDNQEGTEQSLGRGHLNMSLSLHHQHDVLGLLRQQWADPRMRSGKAAGSVGSPAGKLAWAPSSIGWAVIWVPLTLGSSVVKNLEQ